ncbi:putative phage abortive infection protein [Pseudovibrio sp. FO-BEG1]|uniref:putative phage abortive infection protein n=1 Tax=Pseudovibrio sp. (strain FO-BEG1) TaxID=911045 RepID=UPI0011D1ADE0|nr:putative phage abortive infection protein [Pseudovibrio sp. FO-BEG1]
MRLSVVVSPDLQFPMVLMVIVLLVGSYGFFVHENMLASLGQVTDLAKFAQFGDSFGVLTSLFTALAFGGVLLTLKFQRDDLNLTRKEMASQRHESALMRMLEVHTSIISDLDIEKTAIKSGFLSSYDHDQVYQGRDCFEFYYREFIEDLCSYTELMDKTFGSEIYEEIMECPRKLLSQFHRDDIVDCYDNTYKKYGSDLGHYFRSLYSIFRYIGSTNSEELQTFAKVVRAQLSEYELALLYLNAQSQRGIPFKEHINNFSLFDNLPEDFRANSDFEDGIEDRAFNTPNPLVI